MAGRPAAIDLEQARALLNRANYSEAGIRAIGIDPGLGVRRPDVPVLLQILQPVEPLASLVRLFLLGLDGDRVDIERALGPDLDVLLAAGLIAEDGGRISPTVQLTPWRGFLVVHDPDPVGELWPDHVSGPTPAAETLAQLIVPGHVERALDVGTGSGLLALLLAGSAGSVVATDINPAARRYAQLSAALNGLSQIEVRAGSLLEPVGDARFERIVSNPPFVISPDSAFVFRHSDAPRDELSRAVVQGAASHLADGGFAAILCNWIVPRGDTWLDAVRPWLEGLGCDAVVLLHGVEDPLSYAVRWNGRSQYLAPEAFGELLGHWLDHDRRHGIEAIASGAIVLRRRDGTNWVHGLQLDGESRGDGRDHVLRLFTAGDLLAGIADERHLLAARLDLAAPHRIQQSLVSRAGDYAIEPARLLLEDGLGVSVTVEPDLIPLLLRLDGRQSLEDVIGEVAAASGVDASQLTARAVALIWAMLERGYLASGREPA